VLLDVVEEGDVVLVGSYSQLLPDVFQEVDMTDLHDDTRKDVLCRLFDCGIVIAGERDERVVHVFQFREELLPGFEAL